MNILVCVCCVQTSRGCQLSVDYSISVVLLSASAVYINDWV